MKNLFLFTIFVSFFFSCSPPKEQEIVVEKSPKELAAVYDTLFLKTLAKADEVNQRFLLRLKALGDTVDLSKGVDMSLLINESEMDYIWGDVAETNEIIQAHLIMGKEEGFGLTLKLDPSFLIAMSGDDFNTRFESTEITGGYGIATINNREFSALDIENFETSRPNEGFVQLRFFINLE